MALRDNIELPVFFVCRTSSALRLGANLPSNLDDSSFSAYSGSVRRISLSIVLLARRCAE